MNSQEAFTVISSSRSRPYFPDGFLCGTCGKKSWMRVEKYHPSGGWRITGVRQSRYYTGLLHNHMVDCSREYTINGYTTPCEGRLMFPQVDVLCDYLEEHAYLLPEPLQGCEQWLQRKPLPYELWKLQDKHWSTVLWMVLRYAFHAGDRTCRSLLSEVVRLNIREGEHYARDAAHVHVLELLSRERDSEQPRPTPR